MDNNENLINIFQKILNENQEEKLLNDMTKGNMIHAFIKTMSIFIEQSQERTFQGLYLAMKKASELIAKKVKEDPKISNGRSTLTLKAVSEIMLNLINKHISTKLNEEFSVIKKKLVSISNDFYLMSLFAKEKISKSFLQTLKNKLNILVHGYSLTVLHALIYAHNKGLNFKVYITECRPDNSGELFASKLNDNGITNVLILDNSVGYVMENIDCVVVGADAVVENGGIINKIGTFTMAICAKCFKKPVYVLCESLKFLRMFPLDQSDVPQHTSSNDKKYNEQILADYTSPEFITLLFTDLGIFTPSAVSDELIQMFNN
jgi:translation initiation factor eIF-2B subunit alpha